MPEDLSHKLLKIRQNLSLSQDELAGELGVSFATVNRWENGHSSPRKTLLEDIHLLYERAKEAQISEDQNPKANVIRRKSRGRGVS